MASLLSPVRRRFGQALRNSAAWRELRSQTDKLRQQADRFDGLLEKQTKEIASLKASLASFGEQLAELKRQDHIRHVDYGRMTPQVGAIEERVGRIEQSLADGVRIADRDTTAGDALDEARREHEKARIRMQTISWYEERLRRVEASVAAVYEGDRRHPI